MATDDIQERMERLGVKAATLAAAIGLSPDKLSKVFAGVRQWRGSEMMRALEYLADVEGGQLAPDFPPTDPMRDFLPVPIMPSFAGMGGGGTGDGDTEYGMVSRRLIQDELRGTPADFVLIEARGDSMAPDFHHGDQILIDRRDRNPLQPGPFALWDGDAHVIKLVERVPHKRGWYRVFSANDRYSAYEVEETETTIMGRPVWFARRLLKENASSRNFLASLLRQRDSNEKIAITAIFCL